MSPKFSVEYVFIPRKRVGLSGIFFATRFVRMTPNVGVQCIRKTLFSACIPTNRMRETVDCSFIIIEMISVIIAIYHRVLFYGKVLIIFAIFRLSVCLSNNAQTTGCYRCTVR